MPESSPTTAEPRSEAFFKLFSTLWGLHVISHYWSYGSFFVSPMASLAVGSALFLLLQPSSPVRLGVSCYFYAMAWFSHVPKTPNHETIGALVGLTVVAGLLWERYVAGADASPSAALTRVTPVLRSFVLLMYFWATFHKINVDFLFEARVSCGTEFYASFLDRFPFMPKATAFWNLVMAWGTVLIEAVIGVLLLVPRTRKWGFAVGWGFHLFLTLSPKSGFYNFTSLLFALFVLFAPAGFPRRLGEVWRESRLRAFGLRLVRAERWRALPRIAAWAVLIAVPFFLVTQLSISGLASDLYAFFTTNVANRTWLRTWGFRFWMLWSLPLTWYVWRAFRRGRDDAREPIGRIASVPKPFWLMTALFFFWGLTPYLGLKTENSFAMFSNLRTEAETNHLLGLEWLKVFPYQDDTVRVVKIVGTGAHGRRIRSPFGNAKQRFEIPYEGLRSWIQTEHRFGGEIEQISYYRDDALVEARADQGHEVFEQGFFTYKFLQFRRFKPQGPMTCEH